MSTSTFPIAPSATCQPVVGMGQSIHGYTLQNNTHPHKQIAPWTPYMRQYQATPSQVASSVLPISVSSVPAISVNLTQNLTKRHNPYASTTSDSGSAGTSPALGYAAAGAPPNPLSFEHVSNNFGNPNSSTTAAQSTYLCNGTSSTTNNRERAGRVVTPDDIKQQIGHLLELAHTANGSAFLQSAIRGSGTESNECVELISMELLPHLGDLLLDSHGCYIMKTLMERMPLQQLQEVVTNQISPDESLVYSLCTHSLHTRRVVQFLLETVDCGFLITTIANRCNEIATTQQGCIVVQRAMDVANGLQREKLLDSIQSHFNVFCFDPFANYVLQHMFSVGDVESVARSVWPRIKGQVIRLSCNKFASNVVEKCLSNFPQDIQHEMLMEMYNVPEEHLLGMLQDSFGNYIVQTSIALASQKDIPFMRTKLLAVLDRTPYGHKIESRLERRRKGNTCDAQVTSLHPASVVNNKSNTEKNHSQRPKNQNHRYPIAPVTPVAEGEEPW